MLLLFINYGNRSKVTDDTPKCFINLMTSCWDPDPEKRPSITEICKTLANWYFGYGDFEQFYQAEINRKELMYLKKLGPEFAEKPH